MQDRVVHQITGDLPPPYTDADATFPAGYRPRPEDDDDYVLPLPGTILAAPARGPRSNPTAGVYRALLQPSAPTTSVVGPSTRKRKTVLPEGTVTVATVAVRDTIVQENVDASSDEEVEVVEPLVRKKLKSASSSFVVGDSSVLPTASEKGKDLSVVVEETPSGEMSPATRQAVESITFADDALDSPLASVPTINVSSGPISTVNPEIPPIGVIPSPVLPTAGPSSPAAEFVATVPRVDVSPAVTIPSPPKDGFTEGEAFGPSFVGGCARVRTFARRTSTRVKKDDSGSLSVSHVSSFFVSFFKVAT